MTARLPASIIVSVLALLTCSTGAFAEDAKAAAPKPRFSGPYTHRNLTIFLVHGPDKIKGKEFLTLQEAMERKTVVVHETGDVNKLMIENTGEIDIYIQSGDIVKGGKQDRTIAMDFIVPRKSGKQPLDAFCVEHGRWQRRGDEQLAAFSGSTTALSSKSLKLAAKSEANQSRVWEEVAKSQQKLKDNVGGDVIAQQSASSYQLSLESKKLLEQSEEYAKALAKIAEGKDDVIGYAFAINGEVNSVDIYASSALFRKLWPKLLNASCVEAIAEQKKDARFAEPTEAAVLACMADAEKGKAAQRELSKRVNMLTTEGAASVKFETRDKDNNDATIHENYIKK